jgi:hypothetical protein
VTREINLKIDKDDLRGIYFEGNRQKYFFGPETKKQSIYLVFAIVVFPFFAVNALKMGNGWYFILGCAFFFFLAHDYWKTAMPIYKWKKSILEFIEEAERLEVLRFNYNEDYFIHTQNSDVSKKEWSMIEQATINERYIWLFSKMIIDKVKNVDKK